MFLFQVIMWCACGVIHYLQVNLVEHRLLNYHTTPTHLPYSTALVTHEQSEQEIGIE